MFIALIVACLGLSVFLWRYLIKLDQDPAQPKALGSSDGAHDQVLISHSTNDIAAEKMSFDVQVDAEIAYIDGNDQRTMRIIRTKRLQTFYDDDFLEAFCFMRKANRTFRLSRITSFINLETGELISDVYQHLLGEFLTSHPGRLRTLQNALLHELHVLLFVARIDGKVTVAERRVLIGFLAEQEIAAGFSPEQLRTIIDQNWPTRTDFYKSLKILSSADHHKKEELCRFLEMLRASRGKLDEQTRQAIDKAMKTLKSNSQRKSLD